MYGKYYFVQLMIALVFYNVTFFLVANEVNIEEKITSVTVKNKLFQPVELKGSGDVCLWVSDRFDYSSGKLKDKYEWKNVSAELLKNPKEYYGYIKYLTADIDNDGKDNTLAKVTSYLPGTYELRTLELAISEKEVLFNFPVSGDKILQSALFRVNEYGRKQFREEFNQLKEKGVEYYSNRDLLYGFSAYQIQNKSIDVFKYQNKNYLLLNNYHDPYREPKEEVGLVVSINTRSDGSFYNKDICFFKLKATP